MPVLRIGSQSHGLRLVGIIDAEARMRATPKAPAIVTPGPGMAVSRTFPNSASRGREAGS
jgi:hypothetical protein